MAAVAHIDDRRQRTSAPELPVTWIRPRDFARATGMSRRAVYDELTAGRLRGVQVGVSWFVRAEETEEYFTRNARNASSVA